MKRIFALFAVIICILGTSCSKDSDYDFVLLANLGVVNHLDETGYFEVTRDKDNALLRVVETARPDRQVKLGERVFITYSVLREVKGASKVPIYDIKLTDFYYVLAKPVVKESFIREDEKHRRDSIGNDPINISGMWIYGNWLNIEFDYLRYYNYIYHTINLVWEDVEMRVYNSSVTGSTDEGMTLRFYLRHNAAGDLPDGSTENYSDSGICSFNMLDIVEQLDGDDFTIEVYYEWYNKAMGRESYMEKVKYTPDRNGTGLGTSTEIGDNNNYYYVRPPVNATTFVR